VLRKYGLFLIQTEGSDNKTEYREAEKKLEFPGIGFGSYWVTLICYLPDQASGGGFMNGFPLYNDLYSADR
jgi:hypothetical protein